MPVEILRISDNQHFLITENGNPFFWLGDTAWELFHRLRYREIEKYLRIRLLQGYNVILAVALAELDGLRIPNIYGELPLIDTNPERLNDPYFRLIDDVVRLAANLGIYIGLLPTWGDKVTRMWGEGPVIFNPENAFLYGKALGKRYRDTRNIIWVLGGDRPGTGYEQVWENMASGLADGLGYQPLTTYHPKGQEGSSMYFSDADWLSIHMWQSGHHQADKPNWEMIQKDYHREPTKPVLDGEPNYEDHPIDPFSRQWEASFGRFNDYDVRKQAYRAVFAGACGHTYGHHSVWQFHSPDFQPVNYPVFYWDEAIYRPGAAQLIHLKNLMLSRPYLHRIPAQNLLISDEGEGAEHIRATMGSDGSYAFVYIPKAGQQVEVDLCQLAGRVQAYWYDPRSGEVSPIGEFTNKTSQVFTSPIGGPDWVLVLDDKAAGFSVPGKPD